MRPSSLARIGVAIGLLAPIAQPFAPLAAQERAGIKETSDGVMLDFQDADLRVVIAALAELAGINVVYGELPNRPITLRTSQPVSAQQLTGFLENVARSNGLELVEEGGLYTVSPVEPEPGDGPSGAPDGGQELTDQEEPRLFVYRMRHAQATSVAQTLSAVFGVASPVGFAAGTGVTRQSLSQQLQQALYRTEQDELGPPAPGEPPRQAPEPGLQASLQGPVGIVPDALSNTLLIRATEADYETIESALQELDARPLQVLIEVLIAEVRHDRQVGYGLGLLIPIADDAADGVHVGAELQGLSVGNFALQILKLGSFTVDAVIRLLSTSADVTILSRPVILTQNNQEARILVGTEQPFIQLFRALPTDAAIRDQVVQYRSVGTQLTIYPTINPDGYVSLSVLQEVSNATDEVQFGAPVISTREAQTSLLVKDGHTVVIGGLIDHQQAIARTGIPVLRDVPLLGSIFGSTRKRDISSELFLFLTPHVLGTDQELDAITEAARNAGPELSKQLKGPLPLIRYGTVEPLDPRRPVIPPNLEPVPVPD